MIRKFPFDLLENKFETYLTRFMISLVSEKQIGYMWKHIFPSVVLFNLDNSSILFLNFKALFFFLLKEFLFLYGEFNFYFSISLMLGNISLLFHFHIWIGKEILSTSMIFALHHFPISFFFNWEISYKSVLYTFVIITMAKYMWIFS